MCARILYSSFDVVPSSKGASTHIMAFARGLAQEHEVELFTLGRPGLAEREELDGIRIRRVMAAEPNLLDRVEHFRVELLRHLDAARFDLCQFRSIWSGFPLLKEKGQRRLRLIYEANGFPSMELPNHYPGLIRRDGILRKMAMQEAACMAGADCIVTPSGVTAEFMVRRGADPARIAVIPNGVDLSRFPSAPLPEDEPATLVYLGTLAPWQGMGVLLPALKKVLRSRPVRLLVVGSGKKDWVRHYRELARQCRVHRHVEYRMRVPHDEVSRHLAEGRIGLAPLTRDPRNVEQGSGPIQVLADMAAGRPVVASDLPVIGELMEHGAHGLLVQPESVNALAEGLLELLDDPRRAEEMGARGRERAEELTWERGVGALRACVAKVLGAPAGGGVPTT